jgi:oligoendopeptidase F
VLFADYELQAHRLAEQDRPITAEILTEMYSTLLKDYYGDALDMSPLTGITWARIPHFFNSPYYVYQYATCFASTARLMQDLRSSDPSTRSDVVSRYLTLLRAGGSGYPMDLLREAGVDLREADTVGAVSSRLDVLVSKFESELHGLGAL